MSRRFVLFTLPALMVAALMAFIAWRAAGLVEQRARAEATRALVAVGGGWAEIDLDGLRVRLRGAAPDERTRRAAFAAIDHTPLPLTIKDDTGIAAPTEVPAAPPELILLRRDDAVTVLGRVPDQQTRARIASALARVDPPVVVTDLTVETSFAAPEGWNAAVDAALFVIDQTSRITARVSPGAWSVSAHAPDPDAGVALTEALSATPVPSGYARMVDVETPEQAAPVYALRLTRDRDGPRLIDCVAQTEQDREAILAAITLVVPASEAGTCDLRLGAPGPNWRVAALTTVEAFASYSVAEAALVDREVTMRLHPGAPSTAAASIGAVLEAGLPRGYAVRIHTPPSPDAIASDQAESPAPRIWFTATRRASGAIAMSGAASDPPSAEAVAVYAAALFGRDAVIGGLEASDLRPPRNWRRAALGALDALRQIDTGEAVFDGAVLRLTGETTNPTAAAAADQGLRRQAAGDFDVTTNVTVNLAAIAAQLPLNPSVCATRLSDIVARRPIAFQPSSADIDDASAATLDRLAEILTSCGRADYQVAGHTDSQGREEANLALSRTRAQAVIGALADRGAPWKWLSAAGYGESRPIATNDTAEGRARNRRIEFRLAPEDDQPPEEEASE